MTTVRARTGSGASSLPAYALRLLALLLGVFFLAQGVSKLPWLLDSAILAERFQTWLRDASPAARWYIETVAVPGVPLFARLVPLAELSTGAALVIGFWPRLAAALACAMVLNFHLALGTYSSWDGLRDGALLPVAGGLLAIAVGGARLPWTVRD